MLLSEYEEERRQRIAANKQRMQELGLVEMAATLASSHANPAPKKRTLGVRNPTLRAVIARRSQR